MSTNNGIVVINIFTPKPGRLEEFIATQRAGLPAFRGKIPGFRGGRLYRSVDGKTATLVSAFDSREDQKRFSESELFAAHRAKLTPLLEKADPGVYELVYEAGSIECTVVD